ncbi:conserved Plasmodium protein, unknown function [Plasmodium knowlesi strain H]|uniref:Homologous recombination OB-fold protein OB-fold domain-containing protein n=3 Tax=Plasmodium knowlesi TaxID=5850 RepID=A0A5K1UMV0_PLAKH|nr:conserved protein, unknown function [Plasmodium knowlesi strain H]OTN64565.1 Uncharacterized protein PKNOH_S130199900 [Plasmodium knowlesi]CAA9989159.1 conserved protein, unknown function [Plasmodium knowlesi strain H]SBO27378.1 conserved Plasmodium protein, unknown function [Plasmodium knowlesi strain H]SBO27510.1 conserved Plasmodium protein, unknown function [Plasmodium knowlesi strain H]VVS78633.1 conserved protein, unknown function [Plasmodium knowlesi strain H]|eukprot:XP_002261506.1 hypothetical protein, conserved in Plasmodium species [Plasmodium knowlesi strain H]
MLDENLSCLLDESDDDSSGQNEIKRKKQELREKSRNVANESGAEFFPTSILNFNIRNIENLDNFFKNNGEFSSVAHHKAATMGTASRASASLPSKGEGDHNGNAFNRRNDQLRGNSNSKNSVHRKNGAIAEGNAARVVDNDTCSERNGRFGSHSLNYFPPLEIEKQEIVKRKNLEASSQGSTRILHTHTGQAKHDIRSGQLTEGNLGVMKYTIDRNDAHLRENTDAREGKATKLMASSTNVYTELFKPGEEGNGDTAEAEVTVTKNGAMGKEEGILKKRNAMVEGTDHTNASMHGEKNVNWSNGRSSNRVVRFVTNEDGKKLPPQMSTKNATNGNQIVNKEKWFSSIDISTAPAIGTNSTTSISMLNGTSKLTSIRYNSEQLDRSIEADMLSQKNKIQKRKELIFCFSFIKYNSWVKALKILKLPLDPFHLSINAHKYVRDGGEDQLGQDHNQGEMTYPPNSASHEADATVGGTSNTTLINSTLHNGVSEKVSGAPSFLYTHNIHNILKNKRFANYRIEKMMVIVKSIRCRSHGYFIVVMDPSGQMPASIHKEVEKEYKKYINIGSTLILKDVTVFETLDNFPYLIITLRSLVRVIRAEETSYAEKEDILKSIYGSMWSKL